MRRIQRESNYEETVRYFTGGDSPIFKEIWRLLLFAASLGHQLQAKEEIKKSDSGKAMPESYFANCPAWPGLLYLIGICETESAEILKADEGAEEKLIQTFEQHSTAGLALMAQASKEFDQPLDAMMDLVSKFAIGSTSPRKPIVFDGV
jgi:dnd system-associated protein 4